MKNLIEDKYLECEKELKININLSVEDVMFIKGKMEAYLNILESLNQYNLITAPKQIKLSEIISRLKEEQTDYEFRYKEGSISVWKNRWCYAVLCIDDDTLKLDFDIHDIYLFPKWVFTMWIAGTEVEDDLECDNNE